MTIEVRVLGNLRLVDDGQPVDLGGPRQRRLLAALVLADRAPVSIDRLVHCVFGDEASPNAADTLRSYLTRLRRALSSAGPDVVQREGSGYRLASDSLGVDAVRFAEAVRTGRQMLDRGDHVEAAALLRDALSLWRGDAYEDLADESWVAPEAARLAESRRAAQELLADALTAADRAPDAVDVLREVLAADPYREGAVRRLMLALYRSGRPADALAAYRDFARHAADDLGIDPGPGLRRLHGQVLARDPELDRSTPVPSLRGYELRERLGRGRQGVVYAAHMPGVDRDYAIRVYDPEVADAPEMVASFGADVRLLVTMDEPALVPVYDGWREPGSAALVLRRMAGTLADRIATGSLSAEEGSEVVQRVGHALVALARRGRCHGRVELSSVLLDESGRAFLAEPDLGTAAADSADAERFLSLAQACLPDRRADCWEDLDPAASSTVDLVAKVLSCLEAPSLRPENPYVGLRPFEAADADRYFGREDVVADLVHRVQSEPVVLLVGGSGSGKSSIVRAGLVPHLRRLDPPWTPTVMVPGARPMQHLAHALQRVRTADATGAATHDPVDSRDVGLADAARRASGRLVLVVDQLEELFTVSDPGEREQFLAVLAQCAQGLAGEVRVVATVRADYFDQPLDHAAFGRVAARAALPVPPMSAADLDRSVLGPASGRLRVDEGLAAELVSAVVGQPGALPALQFTLRELADRGGHELRRDDLVALGGVDGAIAHRAEQMYAALDPAAQQTLRQVLQRLVVVDDAGEPSRRTVPRAELAALATGADDLVEEWVSGRLLTTGRRPDTREPTVTLAHEAVLTRWPRLRDWVDEDRERLLAMARLTQAAQEWADLGQDAGALPRGGRLEQAERLARTTLAPPVVQAFVAEGQSRRVAEQRQAAEAAAAEQRTSRRLRRQRWMLAVALVVAIAVGWVAIDQRGAAIAAAEQQRRRADAGASSLIAASNEAALSDWSRALLLAVEAHRLSPSPDTERNMLATLLQWRPIPTTVWTSEESLSAVTLDPVRRWAAVRWASGPVDVVDLDEGVRVRGIQARGTGGFDLHDGTLALASVQGAASTVVVLDDRGNRVVASLPNAVQVTDIEFRPDGEVVAIADSSGAVRLLDTGSWDNVGTLSGPDIAAIQQVTWGEAGDSLYAFDAAGVYLDWDTTRARPDEALEPVARRPTTERAELSGVYEPSDVELDLVDLRVVPGEDAVVAVDEGEALVLVDTDTHELVYLPSKSRGATVLGGALTDGETQVVTDGSRMWVTSRRPGTYGLVELSAEWNAVDVDGLDDATVVTVGSDGNVTTWLLPYRADPPGSEPVPALDDAAVVALAPDGRSLLTWDGVTARVLDGSTSTSGATLDLGSSMPLVLGAAFVPGVDRLVLHTCASPPDRSWESCDSVVTSYATDGTIVAGPVAAGPARPSHGATVVAAADVVATVDSSGAVTLRDPLTLAPGERLRVPDAPDDPDSSSLSLSPNGGLLALTSVEPQSSAVWRLLDDPVLLVHDTASGAGDPRFDAQNLAFNTYTSFYGALSLSDDSFAVGQRDAVRVYSIHGGQPTTVIQDPWREGLFESAVVQSTALSSGADAVMRSPSTTNDSSLMVTGEPGYYWLWDPGRPSVVAGPIGVDKAVLDPTGDRLFLWRGDEAFVLSLHPDDLVAAACAAAGRTLTEHEWSRSIGAGEPYAPACPG